MSRKREDIHGVDSESMRLRVERVGQHPTVMDREDRAGFVKFVQSLGPKVNLFINHHVNI